jgi:hypothetical protein
MQTPLPTTNNQITHRPWTTYRDPVTWDATRREALACLVTVRGTYPLRRQAPDYLSQRTRLLRV